MFQDEKISFSISDLKPTQINEAALSKAPDFDFWQLMIPAAITVGLLVLASVAIIFYRRWRKSQSESDPNLLFRELCDAYSLTWSQRRSLLKLASLRKISNPAMVMLDSGLWSQPTALSASQAFSNRLSQLHRMLFDEIPQANPVVTQPKVGD